MSQTRFDCALTFVPADMNFCPSEKVAKAALELFKELFPYAEEYRVERSEHIRFVGPELFGSSVACPICGAETHRGESRGDPGRIWFANTDDISTDRQVESMETTLPACGHTVPFTALKFNCPTGFAKFALIAELEFWNDELMSDTEPTSEMEALGKVLGVPVKRIRTFFALLRTDRKIFEGLMSESDDERLGAAQVLSALGKGHFEDHFVQPGYIEDHLERLLAAYRETSHTSVKRWILDFIGNAKYVNDEIVDIVSAGLYPNSELLASILYVIYRANSKFQHLKPKIKQLHQHPEKEVRWRCAMALRYLSLDYDEDVDVIRTLMLDSNQGVRLEAVMAFEKMLDNVIGANDRAVLEEVAADPDFAAAHYAKKLLEKRAT